MTSAAERRRAVGRRLSAVGFVSLVLVGCGPAPPNTLQVVELKGPTMGTFFTVSCVVEAGYADGEADLAAVTERLAVLNRRMSTYDAESELSRFNAAEATEWWDVSANTARVVGYGLDLAGQTNGAFDPTVGPLVDLWGFGPEESVFEPPSDDAIAAAMDRIGHAKVERREAPPALRKDDPGVRVDLSATAKGYGVDVIAELLEERGIGAYLVEIGGEIRTRGSKPDGSPWRIGVEAPDPEGRRVQRVIEPGNAAVATSGDYRNFFEHEGVRYSHTIDPATGRPVTHDLATVTVLADTCLEADGLATALLVLGPERGYDWAVDRGVAALFVSRDGDDRLTERTTPAWDERLGTTPLPSPLETAP